MIIFHAIVARKHGEQNAYPVIAAFGPEGHSAVLAKYDEIAADAEAFAKENAELMQFTIDGVSLKIAHHHHWDDPKDQAAQRDREQLAEALKVRDEQNAAQAAFDAAKDRVNEAKDGLKTLTPAQKKLLAEHDERVEAASAKAAEETGGSEAQREASAAEAKRQAQAAEDLKVRSEALGIDHTGALIGSTVSGENTVETSLDDLTVDQLRDLAAKENADLTGLSLKADIIAAIELNRAPLEEHTIDQLKEIAASENIDLTGVTLKPDIISAINAARSKIS